MGMRMKRIWNSWYIEIQRTLRINLLLKLIEISFDLFKIAQLTIDLTITFESLQYTIYPLTFCFHIHITRKFLFHFFFYDNFFIVMIFFSLIFSNKLWWFSKFIRIFIFLISDIDFFKRESLILIHNLIISWWDLRRNNILKGKIFMKANIYFWLFLGERKNVLEGAR